MKVRKYLVALGVATTAAVWCGLGGAALAAFPNFSDCPPVASGSACVDIQSQSGEMIIKGFHVPLDHSLEIRGGYEESLFVPPTGTNGFFATPVNIPGGLLGIELPIFLNLVTATAELAGPPSSIHIEAGELTVELPLKLRLSNPLLGSNCHIGSDRNPVRIHLTAGTTNPPPPNRPISGHRGTPAFIPPGTITFTGNLNVENSFSIPGATECGNFGLNDLLIDAKLGLPSAAGNNTLSINNDAGIKEVP